jgi:hypothetical protein
MTTIVIVVTLALAIAATKIVLQRHQFPPFDHLQAGRSRYEPGSRFIELIGDPETFSLFESLRHDRWKSPVHSREESRS